MLNYKLVGLEFVFPTLIFYANIYFSKYDVSGEHVQPNAVADWSGDGRAAGWLFLYFLLLLISV